MRRASHVEAAVHPHTWPVMYPAASAARKWTTRATSSGCARRRWSVCASAVWDRCNARVVDENVEPAVLLDDLGDCTPAVGPDADVAPEQRDHAPNAIDNFCFDVTLSY